MKLFILLAVLLSFQNSHAQLGKKLKEKAREAAERKANQKADEAVNKGVEKIDSLITGKKKDPKAGKSKNENENTEPSSGNTQTGSDIETSYKEVVIKTNIRCESGKKKIESILRNADGVSSAMIDTDNGNLYLSSENPDTRTKAIELIRQNGFEADGKKPITTIPNPCK